MASRDPQSPDLKTFPRRCHFISNRCGCITSFTASDDTCPPPNVLGVLEVEPPPALPVLASADIYFKAPLILSDYIQNQMERSRGGDRSGTPSLILLLCVHSLGRVHTNTRGQDTSSRSTEAGPCPVPHQFPQPPRGQEAHDGSDIDLI